MKRPLADRVLEQVAMTFLVALFFFGLCMCADETEGKSLATYAWQTLGGVALMGAAFWLGRELKRRGIITETKEEDDNERN